MATKLAVDFSFLLVYNNHKLRRAIGQFGYIKI